MGTRRRLLVVAAAGYGKTTALRAALRSGDVRWCAAADVNDGMGEHEWVVVDDLHDLPADGAQRLMRAVDDLPESVSVALISRLPMVAPVTRWRGQGFLAEVGPADLGMSVDQVVALLRREHGIQDASVAWRVYDATCGWPALVRLAGAALADGVAVPAIASPGTELASYIADEVIARLPAEMVGLVRAVADLSPIGAPLCRALGHQRADAAVDLLTRTGLLDDGRIVPVVAQVARHGHLVTPVRQRDRVAAASYAEHGLPVAEALAHQRIGDNNACVRVLAVRGEEMVMLGEAAAVIDMIRALPSATPDHRLRLLLGDALRTAGELAAALTVFGELTNGADVLDPGLAWRVGMVHHQLGEPRTALEVYATAAADGGALVDRAWLLSCTATAHWILGAGQDGLRCARQACALAADAEDGRALAAAHVAMALCLSLTGDVSGVGEHYDRAERFAELAGDLVQVTRINLNRSHHLLAEARFADAARTAGCAVRSAESAGPPRMLALALGNEAEALMRLCRYDDAVERYERVMTLAQRVEPELKAAALIGLGEVHRRLGAQEQARGAYEEAVRIARDGGDRQVLIPALVGLSRLLIRADLAEASALAKEAMATARGSGVIPALLAGGFAAGARGAQGEAAELANDAVELARLRREPAWLAEALELRAETEADPERRTSLAEACGIWHDSGASHDADRVLVVLGGSTNAAAHDRFEATLAAERLAAAGVVDSIVCRARPGQVSIRTFGRFELFVDRRPVPASAWQSRKARDLLRILVARRGGVVPRPELCELLWPDDDPLRTAHRLSVLLSIVRTVSGHDILIADTACVALDPTLVRVDVEDFLDDVAHGFRVHKRGAVADARSLLTGALRRCVGAPFEDDPYADWAQPLREEARGAYLRTARLLADLARVDGDIDCAASYLRRLLAVDPYDEAAHRMLVTVLADAGRHGEARRSFARYGAAMTAIGVRPPAHLPAVSCPLGTSR